MESILQPILDSPLMPRYVQELVDYLEAERQRRDQFLADLRDDEKKEFINGEVICHSPAFDRHTVVIECLGNILSAWVRKQGLGKVRREKSMVKLSRNLFEPDISFFRKEVSDAFEPHTLFYPAPDLVVEVLSKSTAHNDRGVKKKDYALHGVKEYWIVDPDGQSVEQYFLEGTVFTLRQTPSGDALQSFVLNDLVIPLHCLFDEEEAWALIDTF